MEIEDIEKVEGISERDIKLEELEQIEDEEPLRIYEYTAEEYSNLEKENRELKIEKTFLYIELGAVAIGMLLHLISHFL